MAEILTTSGDILKANAQALVNTVNCVGVMGRGIALQFRKAYPANWKAYEAACKRKELQPGAMFIHDLGAATQPRYIINFPTKLHWKGKSRLSFIDAGLEALVKEVQRLGIRSIAIPPLGCGLGGLRWKDVLPRIQSALEGIPGLEVLIFEPKDAPAAAAMVKSAKVPKMTPGRAALLGLMNRYLAALLDPFVTLLEIHKLMYFLQESGQELKLQFEKGPYGPYARNLRHVLSEMEGHFITGYGDGDDKPDRQVEAKPAAVEQAAELLSDSPEVLDRFERVIRLINGFETSHGMELLATVHWVGRHEGAAGFPAALDRVRAWSDRKKRWEEGEVRVAWDTLQSKGWLPPDREEPHQRR
jgi:O-acetyl-ADP-ribose deacetylase (regulator of RNase III)